ncbi:MAG: 4-hydroxy-tetrahydrodipicolinate synthase [Alphaproteobacteria bacterium]|nr:4-hydroxy-tetrahydrodipicolinate synthase [Alphaproteobacteria bacterium]
MFRGSIVALITPFTQNGDIDADALQRLVAWHIEVGTEAILPCGTTGESPVLSHAEHKQVVELVIEAAAGRIKVIAGTGSNSTQEALSFTRHAESVGADAALVVTPYYNKPTQAGLLAHFTTLNDAVKTLPISIYNIPSRSVIDMSVETMAKLARLPNIIGVKDATGDLNRVSLQRSACGADFIQLSGEDGTALGFNAHGGVGCISVTANVAPVLCKEFQDATLAGDYEKALRLQDRLMPLHHALFIEANPGPVKFAAAELGLCNENVRLPLVAPEEKSRDIIRSALRHAGLLD